MKFVVCAFAIALLLVAGAHAEDPQIAKRRVAERKTFTDAEIADGFFRTAFGAEFLLAGASDRIRKYVGPVRVFAESRGKPDRRGQVARVIADIGSRIDHLDIAMSNTPVDANVAVALVAERQFAGTIREQYGAARARQIQRSLVPQCLSGFRKDAAFRIVHSDVILVVDAGDFTFYDCAYEELLQALGPINDTDKVAWTMFNDKVQMGFFDVYDQYLLNILYHPRIQPGMSATEVKAILPQVLPDVRAFVAKTNGLGH